VVIKGKKAVHVFEAFQWMEYITFGIAVLGAVLGVMNTWNNINQGRVRLRVRPLNVITDTEVLANIPFNRGSRFCIEVVNLSGFAVTITEMGFTIPRLGICAPKRRISVTQPQSYDGKPFPMPRRLEPRESVSFYLDALDIVMRGERIKRAYVGTACGEVAYGKNPTLRQLRDRMSRESSTPSQ